MLFHLFGLIGAMFGIVAATWVIWLIVGFFWPPAWGLAILGFLLSLIPEPPRPPQYTHYIARREDE